MGQNIAKIIERDVSALDFLTSFFKGISKQKAKNIIKYSRVLCDGVEIKVIPSTIFKKGQKIEILSSEGGATARGDHPTRQAPVVIKYEDSSLLVAVKPVGMLSCRGANQTGTSFNEILEGYLSDRERRKIKLWIVHRIDREVEGLLIFAKSENIQQKIKDNWGEVQKKYLALTEARPKLDHGFVEKWLKDSSDLKVALFDREVPDSKFSKSEFRYLKSIGRYHLIEVTLHTGRKNQIRAHLASISCPIVGDRKYGADDSVIRQIRLISHSLEFSHPITEKMITVIYEPKEKFFHPSEKIDEHYK